MLEPESVKLIASIGFPAFMCIWFMFRTEKIIERNTKVMEKVLEKF